MKKTTFPLSEVYRLLEPGPVVLLTTARAGRRECHAPVVAFDDGVHAAAHGLRGQQPELLVCQPQGVPGMRDQQFPRWSWRKRWWPAGTLRAGAWTSSRPLASHPCPPRASRPRSSPNVMPAWNARSGMQNWPPNTTSSSWKSSKRGLTSRGNGRGRYITRAKANSWWRAGRSICLPKNFTRRKKIMPIRPIRSRQLSRGRRMILLLRSGASADRRKCFPHLFRWRRSAETPLRQMTRSFSTVHGRSRTTKPRPACQSGSLSGRCIHREGGRVMAGLIKLNGRRRSCNQHER